SFVLNIAGTPRSYPRDTEEELLRIAREAIRNALVHADARRIRVTLCYRKDSIGLIVSDDGRGFVLDERSLVKSVNWGLLGRKKRAQKIGARFRINTYAGRGTAVEAVVPRS